MSAGFTRVQVDAARAVLGAAASEGNVESALAALLKALGAADTVTRETVAGVQPDLRCPTVRALFDTKRPGRASDPHRAGTGGRGSESAHQQVDRYIRAIDAEERDQLDLVSAARAPWIGVVTDGHDWHAWLWPAHGGEPERFLRSRAFSAGSELELLAWLHRILHRAQGKPSVPADPYTTVFEPYLARLRAMAASEQVGATATRARNTQRALWYDMLKGSGMVPAESDATELFVRHTFLVAVARAVVATLDGTPSGTDRDPVAAAFNDGFVSWAALTPDGEQWAADIFDAADSFDWRARPRDVLRGMYEAVINPTHRKSFGEYYTPDWLAEFVVERVCDDAWCRRAVDAARSAQGPPPAVGVLDPACGSGTFLFHAARRICRFASEWTPQQQADIAARLVWGIDIHPVAVEIARATLLRALPAVPSPGLDGLRVHQGDGLSTPSPDDQGGLQRASGMFGFVTPKGRRIEIPAAFARPAGLSQRLRHLVDSCQQSVPLPDHLLEGLGLAAQQALTIAHQRLTEVIRDEGNGVWSWFMRNHMSAAMLAETKIDRIVANPPWVRMSEIQVEDRREALDVMIRDADLYASGVSRSPTGTVGSFDIAALFIVRCEDLYLSSDAHASGWVVNRASLSADNWSQFRAARQSASSFDLSLIRPPPFTGAKSAVWFTGEAGSGKRRALSVRDGETMRRDDTWETVRGRIVDAEAAALGTPARSDYVTDDSAREPRAGANLRPHCLVVVDRRTPVAPGTATVTTKPSTQRPWNMAGTLTGDVPEAWLTDAVFSQNLLVGCFTTRLTSCVIPMSRTGGLDADPDGDFWHQAEARYADFKGRGSSTPDTLIGMLDYQRRLTVQLETTRAWTVVYNKSGQHLRAARTTDQPILNDACYWLPTRSGAEAAYLVAVLNADALQDAYRAARRSDRDFHTHIWHQVPIPRFDRDERLHRRLARLGETLEQTAITARDRPDLAEVGQVKACKQIRIALRDQVIAERVDNAVRELLPDHTRP